MTEPAELLDDLRFWLQARIDCQHSKRQSSRMLTQRVNHGAKAKAFHEVLDWLDGHPATEPHDPPSQPDESDSPQTCRCGVFMPTPYAGRRYPWRCGSCHRLWVVISLTTTAGWWEEIQGPAPSS